MMNNDDLYFYLTLVGLAWAGVASAIVAWNTYKMDKMEQSIARIDDRVTHVYDELAKLDAKTQEAQAVQVY